MKWAIVIIVTIFTIAWIISGKEAPELEAPYDPDITIEESP